jgi:hypothetical protein
MENVKLVNTVITNLSSHDVSELRDALGMITRVTSIQEASFSNPGVENDYFHLFFMVLLSPSMFKSGYYKKLNHDRFPHNFLIQYLHSSNSLNLYLLSYLQVR